MLHMNLKILTPKKRREIHETSNVETLKCMKDVNGPQTRAKLENDKKAQGPWDLQM